MPSAIGLAGLGTVPGLIGWHAVDVTNSPEGAALASAIRGARANSIAAGSLQLAVMKGLGEHGPQGAAAFSGEATGGASSANAASDLYRRQAQRLDGVDDAAVEAERNAAPAPGTTTPNAADARNSTNGADGATVDGSAFRWRAADHVQTQAIQALRHRVGAALDILQNRLQASQGLDQEDRTAPLAVGYFQQDQDLTPDVALAVSLAAAASRAPRSATLADALGHMLSLSASTTPAVRSALRRVDDGGASGNGDVGDVVDVDASAVTHRTLERALRLLVEQQAQGAGVPREPLQEILAAFAPARIAPFGEGVRIGIVRHWSGSIASVQTASSFATTVAPSDVSDRFMRNMLNQLSHSEADGSIDAGPHAGDGNAVSEARLLQMLDVAFVEEAHHASIDIRETVAQETLAARHAPTASQSDGPRGRSETAEPFERAAMSAASAASTARSVPLLFSRLLSLSGDDAPLVQALSRRLHQGSMLAAALPVLAEYAVGDDPQRLLLPSNEGGGQWVMLADSPTFHVDIWADPSGGLCADTEVKWQITQYGASTDPGPDRGRAAASTSNAMQTPTAPSWLQIRRVVHSGRDDIDAAPDTRAAPVALTYGVSHLVCEIAHRMAFHAESGSLA
jgi:hypothetical protein